MSGIDDQGLRPEHVEQPTSDAGEEAAEKKDEHAPQEPPVEPAPTTRDPSDDA